LLAVVVGAAAMVVVVAVQVDYLQVFLVWLQVLRLL
jgi:hypothetical protein